jgi:RecA-family ATPase
MARDAKEAALWLCDQLGISPDRLGWRKADRQAPPSGGTAPPEAKPRAETPPPQEAAKPEFVPLADFIAGPSSSSYLIKHVLPAVGLGQVFGSSNVGKSFLLIDLAMHLASGRAWRGQRTKKIPVLYIAADGMAGLAGRMKAWTQRYGWIPDRLYVRPYSVQLTVQGAALALAERIQSLPEKPRLIILDTLAANFGPGDENSAQDMARAS